MRRIAAEIREETGLTCSVGISESRMLAKIASELGKPAGLVVLSRAEALERFARGLPWPCPRDRAEDGGEAAGMGIRTLAELRAADTERLGESFGPRQGRWLHGRARFEDDTPLTVVRETKSQSAETTFDVDVRDHAELAASLSAASPRSSAGACASATWRAARSGSRCASTTGPTSPAPTRSRHPTNDPAVVAPVALDLLRAYDPPRPVRLLGVRVASFESGESLEARARRAAGPASARASSD